MLLAPAAHALLSGFLPNTWRVLLICKHIHNNKWVCLREHADACAEVAKREERVAGLETERVAVKQAAAAAERAQADTDARQAQLVSPAVVA